jgi:hypothetical protein
MIPKHSPQCQYMSGWSRQGKVQPRRHLPRRQPRSLQHRRSTGNHLFPLLELGLAFCGADIVLFPATPKGCLAAAAGVGECQA